MLNNTILYNKIIEYKNNNINDKNYTGYEIYKQLIPKYIFDNISIIGTYTQPLGGVVPNVTSSKLSFVQLPLLQYYSSFQSFAIDFETKLLLSMTFSNPAGVSLLVYKIPLKLSNEMTIGIRTLSSYSYESIVSKFSEIIIDNIVNNTSLLTIGNGSYVSTSIL